MQPIQVLATGMVTGVGLTSPAAAAAMRCALDGFVETRFRADGGGWIVGCPVPLQDETGELRGRAKLLAMAARAVAECLEGAGGLPTAEIPLLICVAEKDRPGRLEGLDASFVTDFIAAVGQPFHAASALAPYGRVALAAALRQAGKHFADGRPACLIVGTDSYLAGRTLSAYDGRGRILSDKHTNGFLPGEAAGAILIAPDQPNGPGRLRIIGLGFGQEQATIESEEPCKADGLTEAIRQALADAGVGYEQLDYRITDIAGEQYSFREAALALARTTSEVKAEFDLWHPADSIGEVGAAVGPIVVAMAHAAAVKGYAPGPGVLLHFSADDGRRAAVLLRDTHHSVGQ